MENDSAGLFSGPVSLMLTNTSESLPGPTALPGGSIWEWKYDGYRVCLQAPPAGGINLWSRNGTDLSAAFPDLVAAATDQVPPGVVLDGEAVVLAGGTLSFDQLQHRMVSQSAVAARLAREHPASYIAFDVLAVAGADIRDLPWRERRILLDELGTGFQPPIQISPYTGEHSTALDWLTDLPPGIEGLVTKGQATPYRPGHRGWLKTKLYQTHDTIIGAVIGPVSRPDAIVVGRYTADGTLRIVGRSTLLNRHQAAQLAETLTAVPAADHPWPAEIGAGHFGGGTVTLTHVAPTIVVEIAADPARQGDRHRHSVRMIRLRPDLTVTDLTVSDGPGSS